MTMTPHQILDVVQLVYFVIVLPLTILLVIKHGLRRQAGWFYLLLLSLLRIIGAGTGIASVSHPSSQSLLECSIICASIGISPLLLAALGLLDRVNSTLQRDAVPKIFGTLLHIPIIGGLILAIVAGVKQFSSDPNTVSEGEKFLEAASLLFLLGLLGVAGISIALFGRRVSAALGDHRLVYAVLLSLPFILVRIIYTIITAFDHNSTTFNIESTTHTAVIVQAMMSVLMEFIVVALYVVAGFAVGQISTQAARVAYAGPPPPTDGVVKEFGSPA